MSNKNKKITKTAWLYVFIALFVTVLSFFSATLAWYIKTQTKNVGIQFANPVVVEITANKQQDIAIEGNFNSLKPGGKVKVNTGIKGGKNTSNAYVRAKITLICEDILDESGNVIRWDNYVIADNGTSQAQNVIGVKPIESKWAQVNFVENDQISTWYVLKTSDGVAEEVTQDTQALFYEGEIRVSPLMDNRFAGKTIQIKFVVESIQTEGVVDPIACGEWGKLK